MKKLYYLLILLTNCTYLNAQTPVFKNYTTEDGLVSNQIHDIVEDENGILWLATDRGLVTFNGEKFNTYTTKHGLIDNSILSLYKSNSGRIYLSSFNGGLCYYYKDSFYRHKLNPEIKQLTRNQFIVSVAEDSDTSIYFTANGVDSIFKITTDDKLTKFHPNYLDFPHPLTQQYFLKKINNTWVFVNNVAKSYKQFNNIENTLYSPDKETIIFDSYQDMLIIKRGVISTPEQNIIVAYKRFQDDSYKGYIAKFKNGKYESTLTFDKEIQFVYSDTVNKLFFVCFKDNGVYKYNSINDVGTDNYEQILPNTTISAIHLDRYGNYWLTSNQSGLYKIPSLYFTNYSAIIKPSYRVTANDSNLVWIDKGGYINTLANSNASKFLINKKYADASFFSLSDELLITRKGVTIQIININNGKQVSIEYLGGIACVKTINDNKFVIGGLLGFDIIENNKIIYSSKTNHALYERITSIEKVNNSELLIGSLNGLYHYKNNKITAIESINKLQQGTISIIKKLKDDLFVIANNGDFLCLFNLKDESFIDLRPYFGPITITDICINNDSSFWISSNNGIYTISIKESDINVKVIDKRDGLISNNIISINKVKNKLWVVTSKGTMSIDLTKINKPNRQPIIIAKTITLGEHDITNSGKIFNWGNYTLNASYNSTSSSSENQMRYGYYLRGFDNDTLITTDNNIKYTSLPSGEYQLSIWAIDKNGMLSQNTISTSFTIKKRYTETWWFISILILGGILIVSGIFLLIIRNLNRRSTLQKNLLLSEQKALRAQMNPHFTFNALNSIQYFLTDNDKRSATTFLSKFSMLVRKVLYNSNNNLITLEEEISTLKLYLDLEALRFGDKLNINIHVDDDMYTDDILVPSMIIQPFLENAIWHGIMPKESGKGNLNLSFSISNNQLVCKIKDDGIGREKSAKLKEQQRKGHKSTGLKNIEDRISVLNHINPNNKISLTINDLKNTDNEAVGTEVIIIFEQGG